MSLAMKLALVANVAATLAGLTLTCAFLDFEMILIAVGSAVYGNFAAFWVAVWLTEDDAVTCYAYTETRYGVETRPLPLPRWGVPVGPPGTTKRTIYSSGEGRIVRQIGVIHDNVTTQWEVSP